MFLIDNRIFCPSRRTPMAASTEIALAFRSIRVFTTVPSRISLTMSSSAKLRAHQASQSVLTLRQARLTTSLPTAPPNRPNSARFTRRVLVPAR
jgi:hypothetical protein